MRDILDFTSENSEKQTSCVQISEDEMQATLELVQPEEGHEYTLNELKHLLAENGVKQGINDTALQKMIDNKVYNRAVTVAVGKPCVDGKSGEYIYHFRTQMPSGPKILKDGTVDYHNMDLFEPVTVGQLIAEYKPPTNGEFGYTVTGTLMTPKKGLSLAPLRGKGFTVSEDKTKYVSIMNGRIEMQQNGAIEISNIYNVTGDLDLSIGNIRFDGDVYIAGNVESGLSIMATGNVVIDGHVERANIRSGGDIVIKQGMFGQEQAMIEAGGEVFGKFFEAVNIKAKGCVKGNYFLNCHVVTDDVVEASGSKGIIIGGTIQALKQIKAQVIGNVAEILTEVSTGIAEEHIKKYKEISQELVKAKTDLESFQKKSNQYEEALKAKGKNPQIDDVFIKVSQALLVRKRTIKHKMDEYHRLMSIIAEKGKSRIVVSGAIYPNVKIRMDYDTILNRELMRNRQFVLKDGKIQIYEKFS